LQKAVRSLETGQDDVQWEDPTWRQAPEKLREAIRRPNDLRLWSMTTALRIGCSPDEVSRISHVDPWFTRKLGRIVDLERRLQDESLTDELLWTAKRAGFTDKQIAQLRGIDEAAVREKRYGLGMVPTYKMVDTCAAEFEAFTPYFYSTYEYESEAPPLEGMKALVVGSGPIRIGAVMPLSGTSELIGRSLKVGADIAMDQINKAGGINVGGRRMQVELIRADTNEMTSEPDATNAIERVITRDRADFLIGGFRSEAVLAMQEVAMDHKKIFLGAGAAHSKLGQNVEDNYSRYKYWFRYTPTKDVDLARTLFAVMGSIAQQIRTELKTDTPKVALLAEKAVWTQALVAAAQKNLPAMKMELVGLIGASGRQASASSGPAARWMAPATPPPDISSALAALTTTSMSSCAAMSPTPHSTVTSPSVIRMSASLGCRNGSAHLPIRSSPIKARRPHIRIRSPFGS
jgi:ABC-type branched-subunit amino acid transport system substrate-binding protein